MSGISPASVLFSSDGYEIAVQSGVAIPGGNRSILSAGTDGTNARTILTDSSGRVVNVGAGVAGTPAGGVLSIQGVAGGTAIPISGTVSATFLSVGSTGATAPTSADLGGALVSTTTPSGYTNGNMQALSMTTTGLLRVDGSNVTQPVSGTVTANIGTTGALALDTSVNGILLAQGSTTSGEKGPLIQGAVTTAAPSYTTAQTSPLSLTTTGLLRVDGSGVTQPVSGTVTANAGTGSFTVAQATAANLNATVVGSGNFTVVQATAASLNATVVGTTAAGSGASAGLVTIQGNASGTPVPVSGTVTANNASVSATGSAVPASATFTGGSVTTAAPTYTTGNLGAFSLTTGGLLRTDGVYPTGAAAGADANLVAGAVTTTAPTYTTGQMNNLSLTTAGALRVDGSGVTQPVSGTVTANAGTGNFTVVQATATNLNAAVVGIGTAGTPAGGVVSVQGVTGGTKMPVITDTSSTGVITSVASATTNTSVLAANSARVLATIFNGSNKTMYIALGTTASTSSYTLQILPGSYWELPVSYTGAISAVWASGPSGNALITELT